MLDKFLPDWFRRRVYRLPDVQLALLRATDPSAIVCPTQPTFTVLSGQSLVAVPAE